MDFQPSSRPARVLAGDVFAAIHELNVPTEAAAASSRRPAQDNPRLKVKSIPCDKWFGWLSLMIVVGYFVVGLWPFDFLLPNRINWLTDHPGLQFAPYGSAYEPTSLSAVPGSGGAAGTAAHFTVELWLEAQHEPANNVFDILTIHNRCLPFDFVIGQWKQDLLLRATLQTRQSTSKIPEVGLDNGIPAGKTGFFTIRSDVAGTDFYQDGIGVAHFPRFVLNAEALDGQLILGNDASGKNSWTGRLFGLALYNRALDATEVARHYLLWTQGHTHQLARSPGLTALYFFNEGAGQWVQDSSGNHHDVIIPANFRPVQRDLLIPPWKDLSYYRPDYPDIVVNILGFIPFGFCFFLHRCLREPRQRMANALLVVLSGMTVSLTIEVIQAWLPNRVSSMTDLLTNTAGTLLGVVLAILIRAWVGKGKLC
jgi:hypothetical protein